VEQVTDEVYTHVKAVHRVYDRRHRSRCADTRQGIRSAVAAAGGAPRRFHVQ
jgi:hypothetical protein